MKSYYNKNDRHKGIIMTKDPNTKKKIGFLSAIVLVITSCIGAGIFFKSGTILNNVHQNLGLAISAWIIAAIGVIAMALALMEMCGACSASGDKGFMEWNRTFNRRWIYYGCKNFMTFVFMPTTFFFMPLYGLQSILDGISSFGVDVSGVPWWSLVIIAFLIDTWFMFVSGFSSRAANIQSWVVTSLKFIPLIVAMVIGFVIFGLNNSQLPPSINTDVTKHPEWTLFGISPAFGLFTSLSAVFFAYDGFYVACGINTQMKNPKQVPLALVIGLSLVTVIYLLIAVSCIVGSGSGNWFGFKHFFESKGLSTFYGVVSILISIGVFGIVNCDSVWAPRFIEDLIRDDELFNWTKRFKNRLNPDQPKVGVLINYCIFVPICILFALIGSLGYIPGNYDNVNNEVRKLYAFCDLSSTWNAIIVFTFIVLAIYGALKNRFTKKIEIPKKSKIFMPCAIISIVIIALALFTEFFAPLYNLFAMIVELNKGTVIDREYKIGTIMLVIVLLIYVMLMFIPLPWDYRNAKGIIPSRYKTFSIKSRY